MTNYKEAFPDFELDVAIPEGFADTSYRNDACPSWINERSGLHLFVDYADVAKREHSGGPSFLLARYSAESGIGDVLLSTDSHDDLSAFIAAFGTEG